MDASARLLRLLSLLQTPRDWTGTELADRLEVSTRTVRNDIERLRGLGYPVHATRGSVGGYRLEAGAVLPPLLLDDDEAIAVAVGLRTSAGGAIGGIEETALRALGKLEQVLPERLRRRVNAIHPAIVGDSPQWIDMPDERRQALVSRTPIGRLVTMEEVVGACRFLLENRAINGINLSVDGGWMCT